jgi:hypothetical protein
LQNGAAERWILLCGNLVLYVGVPVSGFISVTSSVRSQRATSVSSRITSPFGVSIAAYKGKWKYQLRM